MAEFQLSGHAWATTAITWSFGQFNFPSDSSNTFSHSIGDAAERSLVQKAFADWQSVSALTFQQVDDANTKAQSADIRVGFGNLGTTAGGPIGLTTSSSVGNTFQPDVIVRLEDPTTVPLAIGDSGQLTYGTYTSTFFQVALHEIGHALGLEHSSDPAAVMYAQLSPTNRDLAQPDIQGIQAIYGVPVTTPPPTLIHTLDPARQLELIYVGYFNRAADGSGLNFWNSQNTQAQGRGQSADDALKNIANAFTPQPETFASYPFLSSSPNLATAAAQTSLSALVDSVYLNLFDRTADAAGKSYWIGQLTSGSVTLGTSILTIANGATGSDAIVVQNKIAVAQDFTQRTQSAGLGQSSGFTTLSPGFLTAASNVLAGVDGNALNDASVLGGKLATTSFIGTAAPLPTVAAAAALPTAAAAADTVAGLDINMVAPPGPTPTFLQGGQALPVTEGPAPIAALASLTATEIAGDALAAPQLGQRANPSQPSGEITLYAGLNPNTPQPGFALTLPDTARA